MSSKKAVFISFAVGSSIGVISGSIITALGTLVLISQSKELTDAMVQAAADGIEKKIFGDLPKRHNTGKVVTYNGRPLRTVRHNEDQQDSKSEEK